VSLEFLFSGWGGRPDKDGIDGLSSLAVNYSNTPAEILEVEQPLRIERYQFRTDTGGAGKFRGAVGLEREYRLVEANDAILQVRGDRQKFGPFGLHGGQAGAKAGNLLNPDSDSHSVPDGKFMMTLKKGESFRAQLAGGGGWGNPFERDPASVLDDVLNEKVSMECALEQYGVVINRVDMAVNEEETTRRRTAVST
jgi:N-methylhydantoinase B